MIPLAPPPVTLPLADALVMLPLLNATSPPAVPFAPTITAPPADDPAIVPRLVATSPPAVFEAVVELESPTLTVTAELELAMTPLF